MADHVGQPYENAIKRVPSGPQHPKQQIKRAEDERAEYLKELEQVEVQSQDLNRRMYELRQLITGCEAIMREFEEHMEKADGDGLRDHFERPTYRSPDGAV